MRKITPATDLQTPQLARFQQLANSGRTHSQLLAYLLNRQEPRALWRHIIGNSHRTTLTRKQQPDAQP